MKSSTERQKVGKYSEQNNFSQDSCKSPSEGKGEVTRYDFPYRHIFDKNLIP